MVAMRVVKLELVSLVEVDRTHISDFENLKDDAGDGFDDGYIVKHLAHFLRYRDNCVYSAESIVRYDCSCRCIWADDLSDGQMISALGWWGEGRRHGRLD